MTLLMDKSTFVGRRHELSAARKALSRTRLLTLTGTGGVGKTRLALRLAEQLRPHYRDGVEVVELAALETGDLLEPAVAAALGLRDARPDPMGVLEEHLAGRRMLLVLDSCEHLSDVCARFVDRLLHAAPRLRVIVTSQRTLGVYGEQVLTVPPLSVPCGPREIPGAAPGEVPAAGRAPGELAAAATAPRTREVARHDSVRLFVERAAGVVPGFRLTAGNLGCVTRLVQRLEGIPLAIELAAVRLRTVPLDQLVRELDERFDMLAARAPTVLPRHRTLRATMDWSFRLCSPGERRLWSRLSMFTGGVDLDTAETVCSGDGIDRLDVLDLLAGLVDKSVLVRYGSRYRMPESLRAYGCDQLRPAELGRLRRRYVRHYRELVEAYRCDRLVHDQLERYRFLQVELPNVRVALETCLGDPALAPVELAAASALWCFWLQAGSLTEGRYWLERGLELVPEPGRARATALWVHSMLALRQGDLAAALPRLKECQAIAGRAGYEDVLPYAIRTAGVAAFSSGDNRRGLALLRESLALHRALDDMDGVLFTLYFAAAYGSVVDPRLAVEFGEELLRLCETHHAQVSRAYAQLAVGMALWNLGDFPQAETLVTAATEFTGRSRDRWCLVQCLEVLAWTACARGGYERAAALLGAAHALWQAAGAAPERLCYHASGHEQCTRQARLALGKPAFTSAFRHGARLGLDRAVAYALQPG
ncbi:AAA family ATPase [Nonomuraea phyllanthi]|uniref:AAA family ATPase n=1 Tax=Nonomuraea phyllanthi TaxID=2219224 RepID=A0A5C4WCE2_9ACTN|nr:AAA family ATPase [Nonomuraea phyllanthi]KAB8193044.1 AAA family ATPase [Nonomuraea phyllanthi]